LVIAPLSSLRSAEASSIAIAFCEGDSVGGIFRHVAARGLVWIVNDLGRDPRENKALVRAKLLARPTVGGADRGHYTGDPEIEQVASMINRLQNYLMCLLKAGFVQFSIWMPDILDKCFSLLVTMIIFIDFRLLNVNWMAEKVLDFWFFDKSRDL
jgi:hypothetical protein